MFYGCLGDPVVGPVRLPAGTPGSFKVCDCEAGTWLLGSRQGRKTLWPSPASCFLHLPPSLHQTRACHVLRETLLERPEGCLLAECVHMCVGLQVLTCVCQCTWQQRGGKIASEGCSRCQPGLWGCTRSHPVTFGRWDAVFHSPNPGSLQVALVSGHSCTMSTVAVTVMYCVPAPAWRGAEPASPLPHQHWPNSVCGGCCGGHLGSM